MLPFVSGHVRIRRQIRTPYSNRRCVTSVTEKRSSSRRCAFTLLSLLPLQLLIHFIRRCRVGLIVRIGLHLFVGRITDD